MPPPAWVPDPLVHLKRVARQLPVRLRPRPTSASSRRRTLEELPSNAPGPAPASSANASAKSARCPSVAGSRLSRSKTPRPVSPGPRNFVGAARGGWKPSATRRPRSPSPTTSSNATACPSPCATALLESLRSARLRLLGKNGHRPPRTVAPRAHRDGLVLRRARTRRDSHHRHPTASPTQPGFPPTESSSPTRPVSFHKVRRTDPVNPFEHP